MTQAHNCYDSSMFPWSCLYFCYFLFYSIFCSPLQFFVVDLFCDCVSVFLMFLVESCPTWMHVWCCSFCYLVFLIHPALQEHNFKNEIEFKKTLLWYHTLCIGSFRYGCVEVVQRSFPVLWSATFSAPKVRIPSQKAPM